MISKWKKCGYQTKNATVATATHTLISTDSGQRLVCVVSNQRKPVRPSTINRRGCFWFDYSLCIYLHLARSTFVQGKRNFAHAQAHTKMDCKRFVKHDFPYTATWHYCLPAVCIFFLSFMLCTISVRANVCVCALRCNARKVFPQWKRNALGVWGKKQQFEQNTVKQIDFSIWIHAKCTGTWLFVIFFFLQQKRSRHLLI